VVHCCHERGVGAVIRIERKAPVCLVASMEIGEEVCAAESVNGLLRIADEKQTVLG
jgi:hypothetical protein